MDINEAKGVEIHNGYLRIAFRPNGYSRQIRRSLGWPPTAKNIKKAVLKKELIDNEIAMGYKFDWEKHFPNDVQAKKKTIGLHEILDQFYEAYKPTWKMATQLKIKSRISTLKKVNRNIPYADLGYTNAKILWERLNKYKAGYVLKNQCLSVLVRSGFLAIQNEYAEVNPFINLPRMIDTKLKEADEVELTPLQVYTMKEAEQIIEHIELPHIKRYVAFLFWTGMRPGEVAALRRSDVSLPYVDIKRSLYRKGVTNSPKTKAGVRKIYLTEKAQQVLQEQLSSHDKQNVWMTIAGHVPNNSEIIYNVYWRKVVKAAELRYLKPYVTRHSFASWVLQDGENEFKIAQYMGHRNISMIRSVYGHFIPKKEEKGMLNTPFTPPRNES